MNNIDWLKKESDRWVENGIITEAQQAAIQQRYPKKESNLTLIFFAVIGALLVGTGIILLFATNWWKVPVFAKLVIAFIPLLFAQGLCLYTALRKMASASFREGSSLFLSLAFFSTLALIGQAFHTPSDMPNYILICSLCTLPAVYFFRGKASMTVYVVGMFYVGFAMDSWMTYASTILLLPYMYMELKRTTNKYILNYQLLLWAGLFSKDLIRATQDFDVTQDFDGIYILFFWMFGMLLMDVLFRKLSDVYFFTIPKLLSIVTFSVTVFFVSFGFTSEYYEIDWIVVLILVLMAVFYGFLRYQTYRGWIPTDIFALAIPLMVMVLPWPKIAGTAIAMVVGVYYIILGTRQYLLRYLNYGMLMVISVIAVRFFDEYMSLFGRGVVFIVIGFVFIGANIYITQQRKGAQR